jgi:hypothetical protein
MLSKKSETVKIDITEKKSQNKEEENVLKKIPYTERMGKKKK